MYKSDTALFEKRYEKIIKNFYLCPLYNNNNDNNSDDNRLVTFRVHV